MESFSLSAGADLINDLAHPRDPVSAVVEMIWNGLDADANKVVVTLERNDIDGISGVTVADDGEGMLPERLVADFRTVGQSWKQTKEKTPGGRTLHGKAGRGRIRAYALGTHIRWQSTAEDPTGVLQTTSVWASETQPDHWTPTTTPAAEGTGTGTTMTATGRDSLNALDTDKTRQRITQEFAPYLLQWPDVTIVYDGSPIDPNASMADDTQITVAWEHAGETKEAQLRIIQWLNGRTRALHLCASDSVTLETVYVDLPAPDFTYSAYLSWDQMSEHRNEWALADLSADSPMAPVLAAVRDAISAHFQSIRDISRKHLVEQWVAEETYPYKGDPTTEEERIERATFDVVATSMRKQIPAPKKQRSLLLKLLRDNLQTRPDQLAELIRQYANLSDEEAEQLDHLISATGLSAIIRSTHSVLHRLEVLHALERILFEDEPPNINERGHLHPILQREFWIFGEQYNLMVSERGLTEVLKRHLHNLRPQGTAQVTPVSTPEGRTGRVDLMLSGKALEYGRSRHLVVELKAPHIQAGIAELNQIQGYAGAVTGDAQFQGVTAEWDFTLVTTERHDSIRMQTSQADRPNGLVNVSVEGNQTVRVWARTWAEVFEECRNRLTYYQQLLGHDPSNEQVRDFLANTYADVLGNALNTSD